MLTLKILIVFSTCVCLFFLSPGAGDGVANCYACKRCPKDQSQLECPKGTKEAQTCFKMQNRDGKTLKGCVGADDPMCEKAIKEDGAAFCLKCHNDYCNTANRFGSTVLVALLLLSFFITVNIVR